VEVGIFENILFNMRYAILCCKDKYERSILWHIDMGTEIKMQLLPPSIEEYVGPDDPVRAYNAFVDSLSLDELGIIWDEHKVGNSEYDPKAMIKLVVYGYSYGFRSSRKLEKATYHNLSFIWFMGGLKPDHKTIARFRKNNRNALKNILIPPMAGRLCIKLDLIEGNTLFVDGTKIRANASIHNTWTPARLILNTCRKTAIVSQRLTDTPRECGTTFHSFPKVEFRRTLRPAMSGTSLQITGGDLRPTAWKSRLWRDCPFEFRAH
jgi:transposase